MLTVMMIEYISALMIFCAINYSVWYALDFRLWIPTAFDYKPFNCRKCMTFWTILAVGAGCILGGFVTCGVTLVIIAALNALAMHIHEKRFYNDDYDGGTY